MIHLQSQLTKLQETIIDKKCVLLFYNEPFIWKKNYSCCYDKFDHYFTPKLNSLMNYLELTKISIMQNAFT